MQNQEGSEWEIIGFKTRVKELENETRTLMTCTPLPFILRHQKQYIKALLRNKKTIIETLRSRLKLWSNLVFFLKWMVESVLVDFAPFLLHFRVHCQTLNHTIMSASHLLFFASLPWKHGSQVCITEITERNGEEKKNGRWSRPQFYPVMVMKVCAVKSMPGIPIQDKSSEKAREGSRKDSENASMINFIEKFSTSGYSLMMFTPFTTTWWERNHYRNKWGWDTYTYYYYYRHA